MFNMLNKDTIYIYMCVCMYVLYVNNTITLARKLYLMRQKK